MSHVQIYLYIHRRAIKLSVGSGGRGYVLNNERQVLHFAVKKCFTLPQCSVLLCFERVFHFAVEKQFCLLLENVSFCYEKVFHLAVGNFSTTLLEIFSVCYGKVFSLLQ